jgi:hypothetical protein
MNHDGMQWFHVIKIFCYIISAFKCKSAVRYNTRKLGTQKIFPFPVWIVYGPALHRANWAIFKKNSAQDRYELQGHNELQGRNKLQGRNEFFFFRFLEKLNNFLM